MNKNVIYLALVSTIFVAPCFAIDQATSNGGATGLVTTLLYSYAPWVIGFVLDTAISKLSVKILKCLMTATLSMVLGYPCVMFAFTSLAAPGGPDSLMAWALASSTLTLAIGSVKIVSYWVANESFPNKKVALLLFLNAALMVGVAYAMQMLIKK